MAIKVLKCPSCGANLELEDNREFGFCKYCGAKVQIREIIEVRHKVDNSEVKNNFAILADREFFRKIIIWLWNIIQRLWNVTRMMQFAYIKNYL